MIIANYQAVCGAIDNLCAPMTPKRILLLRGESGFGKTSVIRMGLARNTIKHIALQISGDFDVGELIARTRQIIGETCLPSVVRELRDTGSPLTSITSNFLIGWRNQINVVVARGAEFTATLTDALFSDLASFSEPIVYVLDDFEKSSPAFQEFICRRFLARVARAPPVRVLIAGQRIPDPNNIDWGNECEGICDLDGVAEAEHWVPVVRAMKRQTKSKNLEDFLTDICLALGGRPDRIMQLIEALPKETA